MTLEVVGVWVLIVLIVLLVALLIAQDMIISKRDGRFAGTRYADRPKVSVAAAPSDKLTKMINDVHHYTLAEVRAEAELAAYPLEGEALLSGGADMSQPGEHAPCGCQSASLCVWDDDGNVIEMECATCGADKLGLRIKPCEMPQLDTQLTARAAARMSDEQRDWQADLAAQVKRIAELEAEASALLGRLVDGDRRMCDPPR